MLQNSQDQAPYFGERPIKMNLYHPYTNDEWWKTHQMLFVLHLIWKIADSEFVLKWASNKTNEMPLETHAFKFLCSSPTKNCCLFYMYVCAIGRGTWQKNKLATPHAELRAQDASKSFGAAHGPARLTSSPLSNSPAGKRWTCVCDNNARMYLLRALPPLLSESERVCQLLDSPGRATHQKSAQGCDTARKWGGSIFW